MKILPVFRGFSIRALQKPRVPPRVFLGPIEKSPKNRQYFKKVPGNTLKKRFRRACQGKTGVLPLPRGGKLKKSPGKLFRSIRISTAQGLQTSQTTFSARALCKTLSEGSFLDPSDRILQRAGAKKSGLACLSGFFGTENLISGPKTHFLGLKPIFLGFRPKKQGLA